MRSAAAARTSLAIYCLVAVSFLVAPIIIVLVLSVNSSRFLEFPPPGLTLNWYAAYFRSPDWVRATVHSFEIGALAALIAGFVGTAASFALVRGRFRGRRLLFLASLSPVIVPQIIFAIGVYLFYAPLGLLGSLLGVALAHSVLGLPFVILTVTARLRTFDSSLELVAQTLGADPVAAVRSITLPIIRPAIITAMLFAFMTSFDEVVVAIFIATGDALTLPARMWQAVRLELEPTISAVAALIVVFGALVLAAVSLLDAAAQRRARA